MRCSGQARWRVRMCIWHVATARSAPHSSGAYDRLRHRSPGGPGRWNETRARRSVGIARPAPGHMNEDLGRGTMAIDVLWNPGAVPRRPAVPSLYYFYTHGTSSGSRGECFQICVNIKKRYIANIRRYVILALRRGAEMRPAVYGNKQLRKSINMRAA